MRPDIAPTTLFALLLGLVTVTGVPCFAQDPDYDMYVSGGGTNILEDTTTGTSYYVRSEDEPSFTAWSFGVCLSDPSVVSIESVGQGFHAAPLNDGDGPDLWVTEIFPGVGFTVTGMTTDPLLDPDDRDPPYYVYIANAFYAAQSIGVVEIDYCETLGDPAVEVSLTTGLGNVVGPGLNGSSIDVIPPFVHYIVVDTLATYDPGSGAGDDFVCTLAMESASLENENVLTTGFSISLRYDGPVTLLDSEPAGFLAAINDGDGPDFFGEDVDPVGGPGYTLGAVNLLGSPPMQIPPQPTPAVDLFFAVDPSLLQGNSTGATVDLAFEDGLGFPPITNVLVGIDGSYPPSFIDGVIELVPEPTFLRADCNDDGRVDIADGIHVIQAFVLGEPLLGNCIEACDANGDTLGPDVSDAVFLFNYRFFDGPPPPAPFPACGRDPAVESSLGCELSTSCP